MNAETAPLRESDLLRDLLSHYAVAADRQAWQDRRMEQEGCEPRRLSRLHGELMANGWLEQNTGILTASRAGAAPGSYRVTAAGLRALRQLECDPEDE